MAQAKPNWSEVPPRDWGEEQAYRVAVEIKRLRAKQPAQSRSAQSLADRTAELGYPVTRTVISDLEVGRRRYVTTAELIVLALALETAPVALMYAHPYWDKITVFPAVQSQPPLEVTTVWAAQWFSGLAAPISIDVDGRLIQMNSMPTAMNYDANVKALERARRAIKLADLKRQKELALGRAREFKGTGEVEVDDDQIADLVADIADLDREIEELRALGDRDLTAEAYQSFMRRSDGG